MSLILLETVDSTNSWLKAHRGEYKNGDGVTALYQTAGRGRHGHIWLADYGMLPLSVLLKKTKHIGTLTLAVSLAVCEAVEGFYADRPVLRIKWPNDILLHNRKLCGILCESSGVCDSTDVIVGVGINLTQPEEYFIASGIPHGGSLEQLNGFAPDRTALAERLCEKITEYSEKPFAELIGEYRSRCVTLNKQVRVITHGSEATAVALDIAENGHLICENEGGRFEVSSGEVSVRGLYGYI